MSEDYNYQQLYAKRLGDPFYLENVKIAKKVTNSHPDTGFNGSIPLLTNDNKTMSQCNVIISMLIGLFNRVEEASKRINLMEVSNSRDLDYVKKRIDSLGGTSPQPDDSHLRKIEDLIAGMTHTQVSPTGERPPPIRRKDPFYVRHITRYRGEGTERSPVNLERPTVTTPFNPPTPVDLQPGRTRTTPVRTPERSPAPGPIAASTQAGDTFRDGMNWSALQRIHGERAEEVFQNRLAERERQAKEAEERQKRLEALRQTTAEGQRTQAPPRAAGLPSLTIGVPINLPQTTSVPPTPTVTQSQAQPQDKGTDTTTLVGQGGPTIQPSTPMDTTESRPSGVVPENWHLSSTNKYWAKIKEIYYAPNEEGESNALADKRRKLEIEKVEIEERMAYSDIDAGIQRARSDKFLGPL